MKNLILSMLILGCCSAIFSQTGTKSGLCILSIDSRRSDQSDPTTYINFCETGTSNCTNYWSCGLIPADSKSKEMISLLMYAWQNGKKVDVDYDNGNNYGRIKRVIIKNTTCQ